MNALDKKNDTTFQADAIQKEIDAMRVVFQVLESDAKVHQYVCHIC